DNTFFRSVEGKLGTVTKAAVHDQRSVALMVDNLLDDAKKAVMFPFTSLVEMFPKFVRELSRDQGKDAELEIHGAEIEIDRRILEEIKNPLVHLVRNCVDHGLEHQRERKQNKKQARGTIRISIAPKNGNKVEIAVSDDGRGINAGKVRSAAVKNGLLSQDEAAKLTDQEAYFLIFQSGVSTSPMITDVSGRGLGLAIVREKVEKLGGTISFETSFNVGTAFRIVLPLTLATVRGLLVRSNEHIVILPTASIERTLMLKKNEIRTVEDRETIQLDGEVVGLAKLADVLELSPSRPVQNSSDTVYAVVLNAAGKRLAFTVDEVLHEQEVLTKSLGSQLSRVRNVASATVLGTGRVVPVLNVPDLIKSAVRATAGVKGETPAAKEEGKKQSVLVVEDSITARSLLKNILETAGYRVSTAVDGIDAYTQLRTGEFDIVVSDVDMPRMNGFDLTAKIRGDKKLSEMPVILVTALESREDRERGIDVGANAYIIKSSFDQSNLLEAMRRLV
ncbi:MAG: hybrid sensor histidine kinase/response regulator, partial [Bacteroidota bacterium]